MNIIHSTFYYSVFYFVNLNLLYYFRIMYTL